jgi:hypothetical protein
MEEVRKSGVTLSESANPRHHSVKRDSLYVGDREGNEHWTLSWTLILGLLQ